MNKYIVDSQTCFVQPLEELDSKIWTFQIPGDLNYGLSFPENYQLSMELNIKVHLQEYTTPARNVKVGTVFQEDLDAASHGIYLSESLGGLNLFKNIESYFSNLSYPVLIDNLNCQSVSWYNKICTLEHSMLRDPLKREAKRSQGFKSGFHEPASVQEVTGTGAHRVVKTSFPTWPFRSTVPWLTQKNAGNVIPPNVNMTVKLFRESSIPLVNILHSFLTGTDVFQKASENKPGNDKMKNVVKVGEDNGLKYYEIQDITWTAKNVYLLYNKVKLSGKIPRDFSQSLSAHRVILTGLNSNTYQEYFLHWDILKAPKSMILYFLRDVEIQFEKDYNTTVCPAYGFRMASLNKITIKKSNKSGPVELLSINGLAGRDPHVSWFSYLEYLKSKNFCENWEDFFRIPTSVPCTEKDRGYFNAFPVDLSTLGSEKLQLILEFSTPPPVGWTLGTLFTHEVTAKFPLHPQSQQRSFEFSYV